MHVNTVSRSSPCPLALDSPDNLSFFLDLSDDPPPIAPDIVPPRRLMVTANVDESRCLGDVKERMGGFGVRGIDDVGEIGESTLSAEAGDRTLDEEEGDRTLDAEDGDKTLSVEAGERRSVAIAMSRPTSAGARSTEAWSSE